MPDPDSTPERSQRVSLDDDSEPQWYCLRTRPKAEHLAAAHVERLEDVEVFCPRVRYLKATRRGKIWFVEAMFPGYLLARFALKEMKRQVIYSPNVSGIVHFGDECPPVSATAVDFLRNSLAGEPVLTLESQFREGDTVEILDGPLRGLEAVVTKVMPGSQRVRVLLDMLGRGNEVEMSKNDLANHRPWYEQETTEGGGVEGRQGGSEP